MRSQQIRISASWHPIPARRAIRGWVLGILIASGCLPLAGADASEPAKPLEPAPITLRGEVVETGCFVIGNRHGKKHRQCAIASARAGQDLGILDAATGVLYVEVRNQEDDAAPSQLLAYVAREVEVTGEVLARGGLQGVMIRRVRVLD